MSEQSPLLLIGIGTAGCAIARGIGRAYGEGLRALYADTDATSGGTNENFVLLGGDRLSGRGSGGDLVAGRLAAESSCAALDEHLANVRVAVLVTALGGGTGSGATLEIAKHLTALGITSIVFATTPFTFEGDERQRNARGIISMIEDAASATFCLPLNKLVAETDNMEEAMRHAIDTVASGVTLFWRLLERPGYLRFDVERLRLILTNAGRGRFATVTVQGPGRAAEAVDRLIHSELLTTSSGPVSTIVCGILAGNDLLLSEVGALADGIQGAFGGLSFNLATVNDEKTFSGRLSVAVLLFESTTKDINEPRTPATPGTRRKRGKHNLSASTPNRGRFKNAEATIWHDEDLDIPTFIRKNMNLDF